MILINKITRTQLSGLIIPSFIAIGYMLFFIAVLVFGTGFLGWIMGTFFSVLVFFLIIGFERVYVVYDNKLMITRRLYYYLTKKEKEQYFPILDIKYIHIWNEKQLYYSGLINTYIHLQKKGTKKVKFCINEDKDYASFFTFLAFLEKKALDYKIATNVRAFKQVLDKRNVPYTLIK